LMSWESGEARGSGHGTRGSGLGLRDTWYEIPDSGLGVKDRVFGIRNSRLGIPKGGAHFRKRKSRHQTLTIGISVEFLTRPPESRVPYPESRINTPRALLPPPRCRRVGAGPRLPGWDGKG
jgi:hypothetical protein